MHRIKKIHRFASIGLVLFIALHLFNHLLAWGGIGLHQSFMEDFRLIYRHPIGEGILFLLIIAQIVSGIWQIKQIPKAERAQNRLQIYSGLYLIFFLLAHTSAVQMARYLSELDTNFYFASIVLLDHSSRIFFIPYYSLGILAFFAHIGTGLSWYLPRRYRQAFLWSLIGLALIVALSIIALFSGWVYEVPRLADYEKALIF
ncbi:MAG: hypothetical protein AAF927_05945 [Bacteroidota bacterium]